MGIFFCLFLCIRYDERRGITPSGTWLPHAIAATVSRGTIRNHARVLAQGPHQAANFRNTTVEAGRLLYIGRLRIQGSFHRLLSLSIVLSRSITIKL